jgi:hypothetical protein
MTKDDKLILREPVIASKIITIRDEKVMLDVHVAELYEPETRVLKQAVRRNKERFPDDFMYELTDAEIEDFFPACYQTFNRMISITWLLNEAAVRQKRKPLWPQPMKCQFG